MNLVIMHVGNTDVAITGWFLAIAVIISLFTD